jgi:photosystem II stability/assembly factor-like uncharacterized protein
MKFRRLWAILALLLILGVLLPACQQPVEGNEPDRQLRYSLHADGEPANLSWVRQAGFDWAVVVFSWRDVEPLPGHYFWELPDAFLRAARFYDLRLVARLDHPPAWAQQPTSPGNPPVDLEAYDRFVRATAERYRGRIPAYIIWNEPNLALEWAESPPDAQGYLALLKTGYRAVKESDPAALVVSAGLAPTNDADSQARDERLYLRELYAAGAAPYFDVLGAHPYGFAYPPDDQPGAHGGLNFARLAELRAIMVENDDESKEVWATEFGWTTQADDAWQEVSSEQQATYLVRAYELARRWPWLGMLTAWRLGPADDGYSLLSTDGEPTEAYQALAAMPKTGAVAPPLPPPDEAEQRQILAPDVIIRLGGRDEIHPHWTHIYHSQVPSLRWQSDFYLDEIPSGRWQLVMEVMHVTQADDRIWLNERPLLLYTLPRRGKYDPGSNWVTARLGVPPGALKEGRNTLTIAVGFRLPDRTLSNWRHDNFQFRDVRLEPIPAPPVPASQERAIPLPGGWVDLTALAADPARFYAATYGPSQLFYSADGQHWTTAGEPGPGGAIEAGLGEAIVVRIAPAGDGSRLWAATSRGLFYSHNAGQNWASLPKLPKGWWDALAYDPAEGVLYGAWIEVGIYRLVPDRFPVPKGAEGPALADAAPIMSLSLDDDGNLYAATMQGPYRSADGGKTWQPVGSDRHFVRQLTPLADGSLIARADPGLYRLAEEGAEWEPLAKDEHVSGGLAFAASGDNWLVGTRQQGVYRSNDGGATWERLGGPWPGVNVTAIVEKDGILLAGGQGGLLRSADDGQSWESVGPPIAQPVITALAADPQTVYAATPGGLYRSADGGASWRQLGPPLRAHALALSPDGRTIYLGAQSGIYRSADGGASWQRNERMADILFYTLAVDPSNPRLVYGGTWGNNLARSKDGGESWRPIHSGLETLTVHSILLNPANPSEIWVGTVEDIYRSDDRGASWQALRGPRVGATTYALWRDTERGAVLAGTSNGLYRSSDGGASWERLDLGLAAAVTVLCPGDGVLYAGTEGAGLYRSLDGGESWQAWGTSLADHSIYALLPRPGELWVGGDMGLVALAEHLAETPR